MSNADRSIWQFPKNEVGKVIGWSAEASPSNPDASKGLVNVDLYANPFERPVATIREIDPIPFVYRGLNVALFDVGNGDQVFVWREAPGHGNETEGTRLVCRKTDDFGYTFKLPTGAGNSGPVETLVYTDSSSDTRNFASGPMSSSRLGIMAARVNSDGSHNDPVFVYSDDAGVTWTSATIAGLTGPTWNFHSKIYPHPAGGASAYICYYYTSTGIGYLKTTDNGATWAEGVDVIEPDATFVSISEMSVARVREENKWVMGIRTGAGQNMAISTSSDMTTWTAIADSGLKLGSNPPELLYHDNKIWVLAFSRRDKPIIDEYENAVVIAGANASQVYNVPSAWDDWQVISALPFFPTGYISTAKIRNRWYGLFNMENYAGSTQSDTGTLMMLSSDTAMKSARSPNPNLYKNGSLRQWPYGTTITGTTRAEVVQGMSFARSSSVGGWTISRQTGTYGPYAMRIQRDDANAGTQPMIAVVNFPILTSRPLAGKQVTVSMRVKAGSGFSAANDFLAIQLRQTSHTTEQEITNATGTYTTGDTPVGTSSSGVTLTENWQRFSVSPGRIATTTQQICLRFFWTPVGTASSDYIDIEEIKIEVGNEATRFVYDNVNLDTLAGVTPGSKGLAILADTSSDAVHEELAIDWSGGTSGAPTLSVPNVMQRRYVDVGAYASLTDTNDAHAAIQAAFTAGSGREIVFTNPYGGTRYYRSLTRPSGASATTGALTMPNKARIIMEPGAVLDFSDWANSGNVKYYLYAKAADPTAVNLASNAAILGNEIVLTDGSSFAAGDDIIIVSDAFFTTEDGTAGTKGEWAFVTGVSSNTLTIAGRLRDTYNTADTARVYRMSDLCQLRLEGINLLGCGRFSTDTVGDRGIWIQNGKDCHIIGGSVSYSDQLSISMVNILNGSIEGTSVRFGPKVSDSVNQYGPHFVNLCENVHFKNIDVTGGKEATGLTATGDIQGPTRDCSISYSRMRGAWRSGCATHDNHTGFEFSHNVVEDCEQGIDNRIVGGTYKSNIFRRMGASSATLDCAIQLGSGAQKVLFEGNTVEDAARGVYMSDSVTHEVAPGDIDIIDNDMRQMGSYGVLIENTNASTAACGTVTVAGNRFEGDGSTAMRGVEIEGKWKPVVVGNTMRNGNAGRSVYLHATNNGTGTNGPVNPVITDNRWDSTFTEPLIQHGSGKFTVERNNQIDATSLPSIASASAIGVPTTGNVFSVTGTTTINTITSTNNGGAANNVGRIITLMFSDSVTVTNNANAGAANDIQLSGAANFSATANDQLMLVSNGTVWREVSRTAI